MAQIDGDAVLRNECNKNLWMNRNDDRGEIRVVTNEKNDSLWSRVSELVNVFRGEHQMVRDIRKMKPDSVPVGVDCSLSPILIKNTNNGQSTCRVEFNANGNVSSTTVVTSAAESFVKRVVCSPDIPVYPLLTTTTAAAATTTTTTTTVRKTNEIVADSPTNRYQPSTQGVMQKLYHCTICSESFNQRVSLTTHLKMHTKDTTEDPYRCNYCGKTFAVPARLTRHYRTHTGEKPYQCEYCNKSFSVKENLSVHKRIHTKERPYKCEICERAFEHSGKLHRHMRIHTGERPHKCNYCSKTFIQSGQLVIHLRTHTGEKPYVCKTCNKGFTCSKQLKVHSRTHTGEKPYACDICGKSFGYNHVLKLHQVAHYGEKVYKCTICKQTFTSKKDMETHIKMIHSESNPCRSGVENETNGSGVASNGVVSTNNDKENKMDKTSAAAAAAAADLQYLRATVDNRSPSTPVTIAVSSKSTHHIATAPSSSSSSSSSPVYELLHENNVVAVDATNGGGGGGQHMSNGIRSTSDLRNFVYARVLANHTQRNSMALLTVTATATSPQPMASGYDQDEEMKYAHTSKFQIPAAAAVSQYYQPTTIGTVGTAVAAAAVSPSSYSDSSRSSISPKLEIVEPCAAENAPPMYVLPNHSTGDDFKYCNDSRSTINASPPPSSSSSNLTNDSSPSPPPPAAAPPSSVIIHVPYTDVFRRPSSHSNTPSPVLSSPDIVDLQNAIKEQQQMSLPPRKRILKSMEKDKVIIEDTNFRYNSVIQYAKASQIV